MCPLKVREGGSAMRTWTGEISETLETLQELELRYCNRPQELRIKALPCACSKSIRSGPSGRWPSCWVALCAPFTVGGDPIGKGG